MRTKDDLQKTVRLNRKSCIDGNETTGWFFSSQFKEKKMREIKKEKNKANYVMGKEANGNLRTTRHFRTLRIEKKVDHLPFSM